MAAPTVTIDAPSTGTSFAAGSKIKTTATVVTVPDPVVDTTAIAKAETRVDGVLVDTKTAGPFSYTLDTTHYKGKSVSIETDVTTVGGHKTVSIRQYTIS